MTANILASRGLSFSEESLKFQLALFLFEFFQKPQMDGLKGVLPSKAIHGLLPSLHPKHSLLSEKDVMNDVPKFHSKIPPNISIKSRFQTLMSPEPRRQQQRGLSAEVSWNNNFLQQLDTERQRPLMDKVMGGWWNRDLHHAQIETISNTYNSGGRSPHHSPLAAAYPHSPLSRVRYSEEHITTHSAYTRHNMLTVPISFPG
jgi:hypothetical protein